MGQLGRGGLPAARENLYLEEGEHRGDFYSTVQQPLWSWLLCIKCLLSGRRHRPTTCFCICSTVQSELFTSSPQLSHMWLFWCWAHIQTSPVRHGARDVPYSAAPSPQPGTPPRSAGKQGTGGGRGAAERSQPRRRASHPQAHAGMEGRSGPCTGTASRRWQTRRSDPPASPGAGSVEKFKAEQ